MEEKLIMAGFVEGKKTEEEEDSWLLCDPESEKVAATADASTESAEFDPDVKGDEEDEAAVLPGFRFHPTDEELIGFYLRRKVQKRPLSREIIKAVDIYKYEPWELSRMSANAGTADREWYFYCRRGRKYRNSVRPNRVTGKGFWKATGIDKPIFTTPTAGAGGKAKVKGGGGKGSSTACLGLKKSLVYYIGSAGKGTKTDWMMHEFRLPPAGGWKGRNNESGAGYYNNNNDVDQSNVPEAEVWTICRIFKRDLTHKKQPQQPQSRGTDRQRPSSSAQHSSEMLTPPYDHHQWYNSSPGTASSFEVDVDDYSDDGDASTAFTPPPQPMGQYYDDIGWIEEEHHQHQKQHQKQQQHLQPQHHQYYYQYPQQQQTVVPYHMHQQSRRWTDSTHGEGVVSQPTIESATGAVNVGNGGGFSSAAGSCLISNNDILKDWTWEDICRMAIIHPAAQDYSYL